ncbi:molecular chaperone [Qipengyuania sp. 6B39]|uniref:ATP12 family chaperone protein n=1 Tax=Qipengyuania proteolytica TaxID=2867239 RepID=UPI001C88F949|nr:ATP12 family protein [Qipengyuania proteolytica]MBX7496726.1 molecular chaperone [Qipengyuania proteolytica]
MKRFYQDVTVAQAGDGWQVMLDGRGIKTQGGRQQVVPGATLAHALAAEWVQQGEKIDPKSFLFRDHTDFAIDVIGPDRDATIAKLLAYAETDTLCYRADPDEPFFARQQECWEPLLGHLEEKHAVRFQRVSGIIHRPQPPETLARLKAHLETLDDFTLSGLTAMASLAASLAVALLANDEAINDPMLLWRDANLEEEWQAEQWGREEEAEEKRSRKADEFSAAQVFVALATS